MLILFKPCVIDKSTIFAFRILQEKTIFSQVFSIVGYYSMIPGSKFPIKNQIVFTWHVFASTDSYFLFFVLFGQFDFSFKKFCTFILHGMKNYKVFFLF